MPEIAHITYAHTGKSIEINKQRMRPMQEKVFERRSSQYILLKSPPASGKSRAFMFVALDKLNYQGIEKVIIAVPERTIGSSFRKTDLRAYGFFCDWIPDEKYDLCGLGTDSGKVKKFREFLKDPGAKIMICTHATLRFAYSEINDPSAFNHCFIGIDEFHHSSADIEASRLGDLVKGVIEGSSAHVMAMTGSYFRGDGVAVIEPDIEAKFTTVTFTYYDQLSGYKFLHTITLSYDFYSGSYFDVLKKDLDTHKKTIIHIPNVNSRESTKEKYDEVDRILETIGDYQGQEDHIVDIVKTEDGRLLKIIDLVDEEERGRKQEYLRKNADNEDAIDIIIALNLAKEGFDWPPCEQMLTVGYRGSLTEIVQIIGRCTRDYPGKNEAKFINIISEPDASTGEVAEAVNNLLKAVAASLLMEQVLLPKWDLKAKLPKLQLVEPESDEAKTIIDNDMDDLVEAIMTDPEVISVIPKKNAGKLINKGLIPKIIIDKYPKLSEHDREAIRQHVVSELILPKKINEEEERTGSPDVRLLRFANNLILDIRELDINLIDSINPFEDAYEIVSKSIDKQTLGLIKNEIDGRMGRIRSFSVEELRIYWPLCENFYKENNRIPDRNSEDPYEATLGEVLRYIKLLKEKREKDGSE